MTNMSVVELVVLTERGYPVHATDRYYPAHYSESLPRDKYPHRTNIDAYATLTPSERLQGGRMDEGMSWVLSSMGFQREQEADGSLVLVLPPVIYPLQQIC